MAFVRECKRYSSGARTYACFSLTFGRIGRDQATVDLGLPDALVHVVQQLVLGSLQLHLHRMADNPRKKGQTEGRRGGGGEGGREGGREVRKGALTTLYRIKQKLQHPKQAQAKPVPCLSKRLGVTLVWTFESRSSALPSSAMLVFISCALFLALARRASFSFPWASMSSFILGCSPDQTHAQVEGGDLEMRLRIWTWGHSTDMHPSF